MSPDPHLQPASDDGGHAEPVVLDVGSGEDVVVEVRPVRRRRLLDGLIGAGITLVVLAAAVGVFLWSISDAPGEGEPLSAPRPQSTPGPPPAGPPVDLAPTEMWLDDLVLHGGSVVLDGSLLRDVRVVGHDVRSGPEGLVAAWMTADATVPFQVVAEEIGGGVVVSAGAGDQAQVVRVVEFGGRDYRVVATGTVEVEGGLLVVEPTSIDIGGPAFLAGVIAAIVRELVTIEHEIEGLPVGLLLTDVTVQADGFRAELEGEDVRIVFPAES